MCNPRLLDLYCGVGGCTKGYQQAGFIVVGVDLYSQPRYCGDAFILGDALEVLHRLSASEGIADTTGRLWHLRDFDAIHASPPCQAHTAINHAKKGKLLSLVEPTRRLLQVTGKPFVIENVPGAPLAEPLTLCGSMFGLGVIRHRLFESSTMLLAPGPCRHAGSVADGTYVSVHGGGQRSTHAISYADQRQRWETAMGVTWAGNRKELVNAIPPAYTEYIGNQLMGVLR